MVQAMLDGRKTQTRRLIPQPEFSDDGWKIGNVIYPTAEDLKANGARLARYAVGDRLYVREHWRVSQKHDATKPRDLEPRSMTVLFEAGGSIANQINGEWLPQDYPFDGNIPAWRGKFRQGMHMPRWASRLTLTVTEVRIQRLQEITWQDAKAEGIEGGYHVREYAALWDSLNAKRGPWASNPWVAAYSFTTAKGNIDV